MRCLFQPKTVADQVARLLRLYHNLEKKFFWRFCCAVQHHILHPTSPLLAPPLFLIIISPSPLSSTQTNYSTPTILCAWSMLWHDKAVDTVGLCGGAPPSTRLTAWASSRHHQSGSHPAHPLAVPPHPCRPLRKLRSSHAGAVVRYNATCPTLALLEYALHTHSPRSSPTLNPTTSACKVSAGQGLPPLSAVSRGMAHRYKSHATFPPRYQSPRLPAQKP